MTELHPELFESEHEVLPQERKVIVTSDEEREKRPINRPADTKSNEWVVSGYFVNVWEV